jgi:hypothetical protein
MLFSALLGSITATGGTSFFSNAVAPSPGLNPPGHVLMNWWWLYQLAVRCLDTASGERRAFAAVALVPALIIPGRRTTRSSPSSLRARL